MTALTHLSLCTGAGNIDLAAEEAGFETIGQCEIADRAYEHLQRRWPDVPKWRDVRDVTVESLHRAGIRHIDLLSAGYPCQPFASINKHRKGTEDPRHIWPIIFRIIRENRPLWVLLENVVDHVYMGLDDVLDDLEGITYTCRPFVASAESVGAPHQRDRLFVVAYSNRIPAPQADTGAGPIGTVRDARQDHTGGAGRKVSRDYWTVHQPPFCGVDDGSADRMDLEDSRLLGNGVVPQQVMPILDAIYATEISLRESERPHESSQREDPRDLEEGRGNPESCWKSRNEPP